MSEQNKKHEKGGEVPPGPSENPWNRWNADIGMRLAHWSYLRRDVSEEDLQKQIRKMEDVVKYPPPWEHAKAGEHVPTDWPAAQRDASGRLVQEGWNTQHNANGTLENQFMVSINEKTREISFDFKGSDAWSNWKSDLGNAGASEFAKMQAKAQAAYDYLSQHPEYRNYHFSATGHSLGGGMAQSFALKNNIDAAVYNSLPIARDTRNGDYFKSEGGYEAALERYKESGRVVHDVRTPNDIATFYYQGVLQNHYLSQRTGQPPTVLPGSEVPGLLKAALVASKAGALPLAALMGKDHTMGALVEARTGLSTGPDGRYRIPQGQLEFSGVPIEARRRFAEISQSPVTCATQLGKADKDQPWNRYQINRDDGSHQIIWSNARTGDVEIDHFGADGQRLNVQLNQRRGKEAVFTELDAQGRPVRSETVALSEEAQRRGLQPSPGTEDGSATRVAAAPVAPTAPATPATTASPSPAPVPAPAQEVQALRFKDQLGPRLAQLGMSEQQIDTLAAAAAKEATRYAGQGAVSEFLLKKDGSGIALKQASAPLQEFSIREALGRGEPAHERPAQIAANESPVVAQAQRARTA